MATDEFDFGGEPKSYPCKGLESKRAFAIRGKYLTLKKAYLARCEDASIRRKVNI
jgi:hypothetical protein